jgi:hypothetical protein
MRRQGILIHLQLVALTLGVAAAAGAARAQESWDAIYIGGTKVGFTHLSVEPVKDKRGRDLRRVRFETELNFQRGQDSVRMSLLYGTIETPDGSVLRLDTRTQASDNIIRSYGDVADGVMKLKLEAGGQKQEMDIPWGPEVRGPYGAELSLSREPLPPGETRKVPTFIPDLNRVCTTVLQARSIEQVELGKRGQHLALLRIDQSVLDPQGKPIPEMASILWVDKSGQILKSHTDLLGGVDIFRTTKEAALAQNGAFDLLATSILKTKRPITDSEKTRSVVYRVRIGSDDPTEIFPSDARQKLVPERNAPGTMQLLVRTAARNEGPASTAEVDAQYLRANPLIDSEDSRVIEHMRKAVARAGNDPWTKAVAIQEWVFQNLKQKNFSTAFAPASEVARTLSGDCTEHAVLTAAMARAAGIPARCVVGLVYVRQLGGFGPHMWNEVWIDGRWVALDSTFHQTEVDATHIKMSETSLDGVAAFEAFLPVLRIFSRLEIEPMEIR